MCQIKHDQIKGGDAIESCRYCSNCNDNQCNAHKSISSPHHHCNNAPMHSSNDNCSAYYSPSSRDRTFSPSAVPMTVTDTKRHPNEMNGNLTMKLNASTASKLYESCPVSPIRKDKEFNWADHSGLRDKRNRKTMYSEDARTIWNMIHDNTEKMIAEITQKYGNLSVDSANEAKRMLDENAKSTIDATVDCASDQEFSSDSLEDCSMNSGAAAMAVKRRQRKKVCCKKHRNDERSAIMPKRSVSDYFIYDEFYENRHRKVSLSDILNETDAELAQRNSSASGFYLAPDRKSQESLLSDELSECYGGVSYCNSMESILSDDSECKSAPLEALFGRTKRCGANQALAYDYAATASMHTSKSYGSSPNNAKSGFDYYLEQQQHQSQQQYHFERTTSDDNGDNAFHMTYALPTSCTFPMLATLPEQRSDEENIPRLTTKNEQYMAQVNKSLSTEFASNRHANNSNPLFGYSGYDCFQQSPVSQLHTDETNANLARKSSCTFEIEMSNPCVRSLPPKYVTTTSTATTRKYEQNLQKFEKDRSYGRTHRSQFGGTLEMNYVAHKPPAPNRRSASLRTRRSIRDNTTQRSMTATHATHANNSNSNGDSVAEMTSTDDEQQRHFNGRPKTLGNSKNASIKCSRDNLNNKHTMNPFLDADRDDATDNVKKTDCLSQAEYTKFDDIVRKIDVINKLVELEEAKMKRERMAKELRMQPFNCDVNEKGYVKSLTVNFDNLAKSAQQSTIASNAIRSNDENFKRNFSLPDVLEVAQCHFRNDFNRIDDDSGDGDDSNDGANAGDSFNKNTDDDDFTKCDKNEGVIAHSIQVFFSSFFRCSPVLAFAFFCLSFFSFYFF